MADRGPEGRIDEEYPNGVLLITDVREHDIEYSVVVPDGETVWTRTVAGRHSPTRHMLPQFQEAAEEADRQANLLAHNLTPLSQRDRVMNMAVENINNEIRALVDAWCGRREYVALASLLPHWISNNGLTHSEEGLATALQSTAGFLNLPDSERRTLKRLWGELDAIMHNQRS